MPIRSSDVIGPGPSPKARRPEAFFSARVQPEPEIQSQPVVEPEEKPDFLLIFAFLCYEIICKIEPDPTRAR